MKFELLNSIRRTELSFVLVLVFFLPLCYSPLMAFPYHSPKSIFLRFTIITLLSLALLHYAIRKQIAFGINTLDVSVIIRLSFVGLMYLFVPSYNNGLESIKILTLLVLFYFLLQYVLNNEEYDFIRTLTFISKSLVASAIIETILITTELFQTPSQPFLNYSFDKPLIFGTFGNPNSVAIYLSACVPFLLLFLRNVRSKIWQIFVALCFALVLAMIISTKSRASWIALSLGVVVFFLPELFRYVQRMSRKILSVAAIIITILCSVSVVQILNMNIESVRGRLLVWQVSVDMIKSSPIIGIGYGNFAVKYLEYQGNFLAQSEHSSYMNNAGDVKQAHNEYLEVFAETGLIGFIFFASVIYYFVFVGVEFLKRKHGIIPFDLRGYYSSGIIILIYSLFDSPLHVLPLYLLFFLNCSVLSVYVKRRNKDKAFDLGSIQREASKKKSFIQGKSFVWEINDLARTLLVCLSVMVFFLNLYFSIYEATMVLDWQKGIEYAKRGAWKEAIQYYHKAEKNISEDGRLKFNIGAAYLNNGKAQDAIIYLEQSLASFQDRNIFILLGFAYAEANQNINAENILKEFNRKFPNLLLPHLLFGKLYYENRRTIESQNQLEIVLTKTPKINNDYAEEIKWEAKVLMEKTKAQKEEKEAATKQLSK